MYIYICPLIIDCLTWEKSLEVCDESSDTKAEFWCPPSGIRRNREGLASV